MTVPSRSRSRPAPSDSRCDGARVDEELLDLRELDGAPQDAERVAADGACGTDRDDAAAVGRDDEQLLVLGAGAHRRHDEPGRRHADRQLDEQRQQRCPGEVAHDDAAGRRVADGDPPRVDLAVDVDVDAADGQGEAGEHEDAARGRDDEQLDPAEPDADVPAQHAQREDRPAQRGHPAHAGRDRAPDPAGALGQRAPGLPDPPAPPDLAAGSLTTRPAGGRGVGGRAGGGGGHDERSATLGRTGVRGMRVEA